MAPRTDPTTVPSTAPRFSRPNYLRNTTALIGMVLVAALFGLVLLTTHANAQSNVRPPNDATINVGPGGKDQNLRGGIPARRIPPPDVQGGRVPGDVLGTKSQTDFWRKLRNGSFGNTQVRGAGSGQTIQGTTKRLTTEDQIRAAAKRGFISTAAVNDLSSNGWRAVKNGPLVTYSAIAMVGILVLLIAFYVIRGRIKIDSGFSGQTLTRFNLVERTGHWLLATSFIILALTGLALTFGRSAFVPIFGKEAFATIALAGKWLHNHVAFAFIVGLAIVIVAWIKDNLPSRTDLRWILSGGGILWKSHPPAKKFNFGQKMVFWLVALGGISISLSGIALMFPFKWHLFSETFAVLNIFGLGLPTNLSPVQEMQYATLWHAIMAVFLIVVIIAHIYIGTVGMEGAIDAMWSGEVDKNWAKEHHSLWYDEVSKGDGGSAGSHSDKPASPPAAQPAE